MQAKQTFDFRKITPIPLPSSIKGRLYRSAMPFSSNDPDGTLFDQFNSLKIANVYYLLSKRESGSEESMSLKDMYKLNGIDSHWIPCDNYGIPDMDDVAYAIKLALTDLITEKSIVVHCHAGIGRTGTFLACLLTYLEGITADEAITRIRKIIPYAIENEAQVKFVHNYSSTHKWPENHPRIPLD